MRLQLDFCLAAVREKPNAAFGRNQILATDGPRIKHGYERDFINPCLIRGYLFDPDLHFARRAKKRTGCITVVLMQTGTFSERRGF